MTMLTMFGREMLFVAVTSGLLRLAITCEFPDYMQTNSTASSGEWRGHVRYQNTESETSLRVIGGTMMMEASGYGYGESHTRVCLARRRADTYVVAHESAAGQEGTLFTCVQFVYRGTGVVQLRTAPLSDSMTGVNCDNTTVDPWLFFDSKRLQRDVCQPTLRGGFSVMVYDSGQKRSVCEEYGEVRIESECLPTDGVLFNFRVESCVPLSLYMYAYQPTSCAALWVDGVYTFVVLRHPTLRYMWLFRYPTIRGDTLMAHLLSDLVASHVSGLPHTLSFLQLDMVRDPKRPVTSLCVDDYELCRAWENPCAAGPETALSCPRTCGICNATRPLLCSLRTAWRGRWRSGSGTDGGISVNDTYVTIHGDTDERFYCIDWGDQNNEGGSNSATVMLVSEFDDGCRPKYACARFLQKSPGMLFFKLTTSRIWPFVQTPDEPITCDHFSFDDPELPRAYRSRQLHLLYASQARAVPCHLPRELGHVNVKTRNGTECEANLAESRQGSELRLQSIGCEQQLEERLVSCIESSRLLPSRDQLIVTQTFGRPSEVLCWYFPKRQRHVFYLLSAADCHDGTAKLLRRGRLQPLATLTKASHSVRSPPMPTSHSTSNSPTTTTSTTRIVNRSPSPTVMYNVSGSDAEHGNATTTSIDSNVYSKAFVILIVIAMFIAIQVPCFAMLC